MRYSVFLLCFVLAHTSHGQTYFPPLLGNDWEVTDPADLGWCLEKLDDLQTFLDTTNTKAFIVLKDGRMVLEYYFDGFQMNDSWQWNSAGKGMSAFLTGIAQEKGLLDIDDKTSDYLGAGWTSMTPAQEDAVTIWHQLTMTSGMDDSWLGGFCTAPSCLFYIADAGTRWSYHNGPYTLLTDVVSEAAAESYNSFMFNEVSTKTGIFGLWIEAFDFNILHSSPRSMARFGLLVQEQGQWDGNTVLADVDFINDMLTPSQSINNAYGYLWWLNGYENYMLPASQVIFPGTLTPSAPASMVSAIGKDAQILSLIPEENLVVVRMGDAPNDDLVPVNYIDDLWTELNKVICSATGIEESVSEFVIPNPVADLIALPLEVEEMILFDLSGRILKKTQTNQMQITELLSGAYILQFRTGHQYRSSRIVKL